jgi:hypothetical protein
MIVLNLHRSKQGLFSENEEGVNNGIGASRDVSLKMTRSEQ